MFKGISGLNPYRAANVDITCIGGSASPFVLSSYDLASDKEIKQLNRAFLFKQILEINYINVDSQLTQSQIEPHYL